jgi:hypothetical protein
MILLSLNLTTFTICPDPEALSKLTEAELALFNKYASQLNTQFQLSSMTPNEKDYRFQIFENHLKMISRAKELTASDVKEEYNEGHTYTTGINKFSFLSDNEFEKRFLIPEVVMNADTDAQRLFNDPAHSFNYFIEKILKEVDKTVSAANDTLKLAEHLGFDHGFGQGISLDSIKNDLKSSMMNTGFGGIGSITSGFDNASLTKNNSFFNDDDFNFDTSDFLGGRILNESKFMKIKANQDWRSQFNPIFDQGDCNACYITSSLETIEALHNKIYPNQMRIKLSVQEILDCSAQSSGCLGGQPSVVFDYIKRFGIAYQHKYKRYVQKKGECGISKQLVGGRQLQTTGAPDAYTTGKSSLMNQSYLDLIQDIYKISNTPMQELLNAITPDEVHRNNKIIKHVNTEMMKLHLPYSKKLEYDYIRQRFFFVINTSANSKDQYQDLYGFPYIPGIILLNDIKQTKGLPINPYLPNKPKKDTDNPDNESKFPTPDPPKPKPASKPDDLTPLPPTVDHSNHSGPVFTPNSRYVDLKDFYFIKPNVLELLRALQYGPVIVAHFVPPVFKFYKRGVFDGEGCQNAEVNMVNHAAVVVGYNLKARLPYFRIRSSWGSDWGESGYYRISIGPLTKDNKGTCLMAGTPFMVFPYLKNFA